MRKGIAALIALCLAVGLLGSPALAATDMTSATFYVPATAGGGTADLGGMPWFDTGLVLKPGTTVTISASGFWKSCHDRDCWTTAEGIGVRQVTDCAYIAPDLSAFSLIARIGEIAPVFVGIGPTDVVGDGTLRFAINDCYFGDNIGGFNVTVTYPTDTIVVNADADVVG